MSKRELQTAVVVALVTVMLTWWAATSDYSPVKPESQPQRPVLRLVQRLARLGLWAMMFAEQPPASEQAYVVHARVDEHGNRALNHGQGW
jgi:hypothetical protein